jgi:hypothetical protein
VTARFLCGMQKGEHSDEFLRHCFESTDGVVSFRRANLGWWAAHDNEVWIVAADRSNAEVLWSGSDDAFLRGWDVRTQNRTFQRR